MDQEEREKLRAELRAEMEAELEEERTQEVQLREEIRKDLEVELREKWERTKALREFAEDLCGGEYGLSADPSDIVELMAPMDEDKQEMLKAVLQAKVVDFEERGSSREGETDQLAELDPKYSAVLRTWLTTGRTLDEWFELNEDMVGAMEQYDLSSFSEEEA